VALVQVKQGLEHAVHWLLMFLYWLAGHVMSVRQLFDE
jgi:hypothetical protein